MIFAFLCLPFHSAWQSLGLSMLLQIAFFVLFNGWVTFHGVCVGVCACSCMYYSFIHPSVDGHSGCFHVLAIVNRDREHWGACIFLNYGVLWIYAWEWDCSLSFVYTVGICVKMILLGVMDEWTQVELPEPLAFSNLPLAEALKGTKGGKGFGSWNPSG